MLKKKEKSELKFFYGMTPEEDAYYKTLIKVKGKEEEPTLAKSVLNMLNGPGQEIHRLAFEADPTAANVYAGVYKQKLRLLPDIVLKRIAIQDSLVSNIVRARQNHVKAFGRPRPNIYSTGFIISPKSGVTEAMDENQRIALAKEINDAVALLNTCGHTEGVKDHHQKTFSEYLDLLARDSQVVGRIASEIVYVDDVVTGEKKFHYFCHTDAGTIYPAAPDDNNAKQALRDEAFQLLQTVNGEKLEREKWHNNNYTWIQVIDGRPQQAFTDDEMKCRNFYPAGNVELDGFPVTPIDTVITAITTHLNITTHNKVYFQNGRASRGMIIIKSDDVTPSVIHNIKQQFNACVAGETLIITKEFGETTINKVLGGEERVDITIWTGRDWKPASVYKTGDKELVRTKLANGLEIPTSPDHRFLTVGKEGLVWKEQKDLLIGDYVCVNNKEIEDVGYIPKYNDKPVTAEMMEVLGWMTGDGTMAVKGDHERNVNSFRLFYHYDKEPWILDRHFEILAKFGVDASKYRRDLTPDEVDAVKEKYGFKSASSCHIGIQSYDARFVDWLVSLGFKSSKDRGKEIPAFVYKLPTNLKGAFLKGLFSADGCNKSKKDPILCITSEKLRKQTRSLLLSLGIRTAPYEAMSRSSFGQDSVPCTLTIKDRKKFFDLIGFLQPHKQPKTNFETSTHGRSDKLPNETLRYLAKQVHSFNKDKNILSKSRRDKLSNIINGERSCSRKYLLDLMKEAGYSIPQWLLDYNFEPVTEKFIEGKEVQMYDVTVDDDQHTFLACGIVTHNSINGADRAFRMPVLGFGSETEVQWQPIDQSGSRDMEFQYLTDLNAREILTAFMMSPDELPGWGYLSRGTNSQALSECIAPYTRILTKEGLKAIADVVGKAEERRIKIWDGEEWVAARAFRSGEKKLVQTKFSGNYSIDTSPDHRFKVIGPEGIPVWKHQEELKLGDLVLVNKNPVQSVANIPSYKGKPLTLEMMEILGWMTGDGSFIAPRKRVGAQLQLFYHSEKERDLWNEHFQTLKDFGFDTVHQCEEFRTEEERKAIAQKSGVKSVAESYIKTVLYDTDFYRWLISLGFSPSSRSEIGKTIPPILHVLPVEYRQAFLRGLFSADGGKLNETGHVALTIQNNRLRDQVRQLLLSLGIRTLSQEGVLRESFDGKKDFSYKLYIKDREEFWKQIGFVQEFKQLKGKSQKWSIARPPKAVVEQIFGDSLKSYSPKMSKLDRDALVSFLNKGRSLTWQRMIALADKYDISVPQWVKDYNVEEVVEVKDLNQTIDMFDIETFDNKHQFIAEGIVTHNSNQEFKLTAARDVGIRPLIAGFEDFINEELFPLIAPELSKICRVELVGLDAETPEKEIVGLQQNSQVHMTYNDILIKKEKKPLPKYMCGDIPLNPGFQKLLDAYKTVGEIREFFLGIPGASKDPKWDYCRDPMYFQNIQLQMQAQQMQMQQQQMQMQAMQPQQPPPGGPDDGGGDDGGGADKDSGPEGLARSIDQAYEMMKKSEENLSPNQRRLLAKQQKTLKWAIDGFQNDTKDAVAAILDEVKNLSIKKR